ncbi:hypothetical protein [Phascolarctobacterium sp.]|uniref:hypothetical protein n=1 Tax=Phascolarctobacterium sp. TaxID=2049039 RepID=UPI00386FCA2D
MKLKSIILSLAIILGSWCFYMGNVQAQGLQFAGATDLGNLYVDTAKTSTLHKAGVYYLTVFAEEKYTDKIFLTELRKDEDLRNVVGAVYLYLFDNRGTSYCIAANYLVDAQGKVCLNYGGDMQMKALTAQDKTMLNAYTLCLKALENKKRFQKKF